MGKINSHELDQRVRAVNHRRLFQVFQDKNLPEIEALMRQLLSPSEVEMISKRIAIAVLLEIGADYREIQDILKVSKTTVAKANNLYRYDENIRTTIQKFVAEEHRPKKRDYTLTQAAKDMGFALRLLSGIH